MRTFKIKTLGCKVNQYESDGISDSMIAAGLKPANNMNSSDIVIINTCAVTHKASIRSKQAIRKAIRDNSNAKLIVTGCLAQIEPKTISKIVGDNSVIPNKFKHNIVKKCINIGGKKVLENDIFFSHLQVVNRNKKRTRSFLKIQDGCDSFCTYCIVPYARGRSKSLSENEVLSKIESLYLRNYKEVVLTGIHIGNYGKDLSPKSNLHKLICKIIKSKAIHRIRISSIEPQDLSDDIIQLVKSTKKEKKRVCSHFHIPLQSGDDGILKKMHRPYNQIYFKKLIEKILYSIPDCGIGLDIIVGFPGESEIAFNNTFEFIESIDISYLHVFPFSPRKGTPAWNYPNKIDPKCIKKRCEKMRKIGIKKTRTFYQKFLGKTVPILVENKTEKGTENLVGFSENYIPVKFNGPNSMNNTIQYVKITEVTSDGYAKGTL